MSEKRKARWYESVGGVGLEVYTGLDDPDLAWAIAASITKKGKRKVWWRAQVGSGEEIGTGYGLNLGEFSTLEAAKRAVLNALPDCEIEEIVHGVNCEKVQHAAVLNLGNKQPMGYLHPMDDDSPYDVDGVWYCGRCHVVLPNYEPPKKQKEKPVKQETMELTAEAPPTAEEYIPDAPRKVLEFPRQPLQIEPCEYCHIPGHTIAVCARRIKDERAAKEVKKDFTAEGFNDVRNAQERAAKDLEAAKAAAPILPTEITPSVIPQVVNRPKLRAPAGISKSMVKALACPTYFTGQYLQRVAEVEHWLGKTGNEFHAWRRAYVEHLVETRLWRDPAFQADYLAGTVLSDDARTLIGRDGFELDPDTVYGCEVFLSIDREFRPLEHEIGNARPGRLSEETQALCSGTLDLLLLDGRIATICDPKSGFSTTGVTDTEPPIYAALVMLHFPLVETVKFVWDFVRHSAIRRTEYTREDLPWIKDMIIDQDQKKNLYVERYNAGKTLDANPFSGLCPYCQLACPLRPRWEAGELAIAAPQTRADAVQLARLVKVCQDVIDRAKGLVAGWLDQDDSKRLELGSGWEATLRVSELNTHPLHEALEVLGLDLINIRDLDDKTRELIRNQRPEYTPNFDVPLESLTLGGLSGFAKTKKSRKRPDGGGGVSREGLKPAMLAIANRGCSTTVVIRKAGQQEATPVTEELLLASLEA